MRIIKALTSNEYTDESGDLWKASSSTSYSATYGTYKAFDGNWSTFWAPGTGDTTLSSGRELPCWLQIELPVEEKITGYVIKGAKSTEYPKGWTLQGSNDGVVFDDLDTQTSSTLLSNNKENHFSVSTENSYKIYRLYITDSCDYCGVSVFNIKKSSDYYTTWEELTGKTNELITNVMVKDTKYDDNSHTITNSTDWLKYKGNSITKFTLNGNSWIGFNSTNEDLKVNRRDAAMYSIYWEWGKMRNRHGFARLRWDGYSNYKQTSSAYRLTYDVIIFDTGDILLSMLNIPTSNYDGTFSLDGVTYAKPTASNPYVTFYAQSDGTYIAKNELPQGDYLYIKKYLIRDGEMYYNVVDGALNEITVTDLTAQVFTDSGMDDVPSGDLIKTLASPDVLVWCDDDTAEINATATVTATPFPQTVERTITVVHESITGIENATATVEGLPVFSCSFDGGTAYEAHNGTDWVTVDSSGGMSKEQLESISTDQWNAKISGLTEFIFRVILQSADDTVTQIKINFTN